MASNLGRSGGGGMRVGRGRPARAPEGVRQDGTWDPPSVAEEEDDLGRPGGRFGRAPQGDFVVVHLADGYVVHQYSDGRLNVIRTPEGPSDTWLVSYGPTADAWQQLSAEINQQRSQAAQVATGTEAARQLATGMQAAADAIRAAADTRAARAAAAAAAAPAVPAVLPPLARPWALHAWLRERATWGSVLVASAVVAVVVLGARSAVSRTRAKKVRTSKSTPTLRRSLVVKSRS